MVAPRIPREQLKASDEIRQTLMGTIRGLLKDFGELNARMDNEGAVDQLPLQGLTLGPGSGATGPPASGC